MLHVEAKDSDLKLLKDLLKKQGKFSNMYYARCIVTFIYNSDYPPCIVYCLSRCDHLQVSVMNRNLYCYLLEVQDGGINT